MQTGRVWDLVGETPLVRIESLSELTGCEIFGKCEYANPGGSIKDRAAKGIIHAAERDGRLKRGGVIVEGTAGNTGIGLATLAAARGYRTIISVPDNQADEKYQMLEALGADVRKVPAVPFANPNHFYHRAKAIAEETPGAFWANQFENLANAEAHFITTGPEIWSQTAGNVDIFVCAAGTGGTIAGVSRYLKSQNPRTLVALADPDGSGLYCQLREGKLESSGSTVTEGIGIMRLTANFKTAQIDDAMRVSDGDMIDMLFHLAKNDGLVVGTSAALNAYAAYRIGLAHQGQRKVIVTMLCDHGTRYQSRVFNPEWLTAKGLAPKPIASGR